MSCNGCEAAVASQNMQKELVKNEAKNYANARHTHTVVFMEIGDWHFATVQEAISRGIPFDPANIVRFDSPVVAGPVH